MRIAGYGSSAGLSGEEHRPKVFCQRTLTVLPCRPRRVSAGGSGYYDKFWASVRVSLWLMWRGMRIEVLSITWSCEVPGERVWLE